MSVTAKKKAGRIAKVTDKKSNLEVQYAEIVKQLQTTFGPLPDDASLSQPLPYKVFPTIVTYGGFEEPIIG
ncbi:MAG: hypothetical protein AABZ77_08345 [Chloroflexota bacterium]